MNIFSNKFFKKIIILVFCAILFITFKSFILESKDTKPIPITAIYDFEKKYIQNSSSPHYKLIDSVDFNLSDKNLTQTFSDINEDKGVVFSFQEMENLIHYSLTIQDEQGEMETYTGSSSKDWATCIELKPQSTYQFKYGGVKLKVNEIDKNEKIVTPIHGKLNVYKIIE